MRIARPFACDPPLWLAREFLSEEGFTDIRYVDSSGPIAGQAASAGAQFGIGHSEAIVGAVDAGVPVVALAGVHPGCWELWTAPGIASVRDLRGKKVAVFAKNAAVDQFYGFFATLLAFVGIDPLKDVNFFEVGPDYGAMMSAYLDGRSDAFLAGAEGGVVLRRNPKTPGKKILDMTTDKPWSQHLCCMFVGDRDWARQNPVATKRVTRAVLRAADATTRDRSRAARAGVVAPGRPWSLLQPGDLSEADIGETIAMLSYDWRELDPEETLRFFALRLGDVKVCKSTPQQIIANGSDFGFMRQMRKELTL